MRTAATTGAAAQQQTSRTPRAATRPRSRVQPAQVTPVVQIAGPRPADEVGVADVLIGSFALIGYHHRRRAHHRPRHRRPSSSRSGAGGTRTPPTAPPNPARHASNSPSDGSRLLTTAAQPRRSETQSRLGDRNVPLSLGEGGEGFSSVRRQSGSVGTHRSLVNASSASVRTAMPVAPLGWNGFVLLGPGRGGDVEVSPGQAAGELLQEHRRRDRRRRGGRRRCSCRRFRS